MRILLLAALSAVFTIPAFAQERCGPRGAVIDALKGEYGERVLFRALSEHGLLEFYANVETGTWTALMSRPEGVSCLMDAGEHFEFTDSDEITPPGELN